VTDLRDVLAHFPTGMVAITADDGQPLGLTIGSFTSISLEPPLVGFFVDRSSSTWPRLQRAGAFAVNVLGRRHDDLCRRFAQKGADRFAGVAWVPGRSGCPLIEDALAWIECEIADVIDVGDHHLVVGAVLGLELGQREPPLIFFRRALAPLPES
jgi:3-hydroxy-9,10-secoandrosta-1,3,5(10)-triene-9,17-dione monooxygenase reductase component